MQVVFEEKKPTDRFLGGSRVSGQIWIRGDIRAGRTEAQRNAMMLRMMREVAQINGVNRTISVYLCNLAPKDMVEYGHVLPQPGEEAAWYDRLPELLQDYLAMSVMQSACKHPERCVIGHPFNPPHIIPLVEVVAGAKTSAETVQRALSFYTSIGKKAIHVRKEMVGHVANRIQGALYREVVYLIEQGVLDVADADAAVCWGPGLRWGVMGPNLLFHLGGGQGGIQHFMDHLSGPVSTWWKDLGTITEFTPQIKQTIIDSVLKEAGGRSIEELEQERDTMLLELLATRAKGDKAAQKAMATGNGAVALSKRM